MNHLLRLLVFLFLGIAVHLAAQARADDARPSPSPSAAQGGKNVNTEISPDGTSRATPVGVKAMDPSQNGRVNTGTAPSLSNAPNMGVGISIDLGSKPKSDKDDSKDDGDEN